MIMMMELYDKSTAEAYKRGVCATAEAKELVQAGTFLPNNQNSRTHVRCSHVVTLPCLC
jgi:hypothetical protein